jgi:hypothetical protein
MKIGMIPLNQRKIVKASIRSSHGELSHAFVLNPRMVR